MRIAPLLLAAAACLSIAAPAAAEPFVVLQDDGTIEDHALKTQSDLNALRTKLLSLYDATGAELPEVLSVWTDFSLGGGYVSTVFDEVGNSVTGIGISKKTSSLPPLDAVLWHNDVTRLTQRAAIQHAPVEGFGTYLFLLELSHLWGPALKVPMPNPQALIGFPYHWSFFLDLPSPIGGNGWTDNGDGTFTVVPQLPSEVKYSPLDLYIMGLSPPADVPPFQVLENTVAPPTPTDPLWGGPFAAHSFPWFDQAQSLTITADARPLTIDDVVTANGERAPAAGTKTSWKVGIVLLLSGKDDAATKMSVAQDFAPLAAAFAPTFATATSGKGTLEIVTDNIGQGGSGGAGQGGSGGGGQGGSGGQGTTTTTDTGGGGAGESDTGAGCGCQLPGSTGVTPPALYAALALGLAALRRRKRAASIRR